jgi:hypothetical protein
VLRNFAVRHVLGREFIQKTFRLRMASIDHAPL